MCAQVSPEDMSKEVWTLLRSAHESAAVAECPALGKPEPSTEEMCATKDTCLKRAAALLLCSMDAFARHNHAESREVYPWLAAMYFGPSRGQDDLDMSPQGALLPASNVSCWISAACNCFVSVSSFQVCHTIASVGLLTSCYGPSGCECTCERVLLLTVWRLAGLAIIACSCSSSAHEHKRYNHCLQG